MGPSQPSAWGWGVHRAEPTILSLGPSALWWPGSGAPVHWGLPSSCFGKRGTLCLGLSLEKGARGQTSFRLQTEGQIDGAESGTQAGPRWGRQSASQAGATEGQTERGGKVVGGRKGSCFL